MQYYTRNTVSAEAWCAKCQKRTQHRVADRRIGPCLVCMENLETRHNSKAFCSCGRRSVSLCDWEIEGQPELCNRPLCAEHDKVAGRKHLCPEHHLRYKEIQRGIPDSQGVLFPA